MREYNEWLINIIKRAYGQGCMDAIENADRESDIITEVLCSNDYEKYSPVPKGASPFSESEKIRVSNLLSDMLQNNEMFAIVCGMSGRDIEPDLSDLLYEMLEYVARDTDPRANV